MKIFGSSGLPSSFGVCRRSRPSFLSSRVLRCRSVTGFSEFWFSGVSVVWTRSPRDVSRGLSSRRRVTHKHLCGHYHVLLFSSQAVTDTSRQGSRRHPGHVTVKVPPAPRTPPPPRHRRHPGPPPPRHPFSRRYEVTFVYTPTVPLVHPNSTHNVGKLVRNVSNTLLCVSLSLIHLNLLYVFVKSPGSLSSFLLYGIPYSLSPLFVVYHLLDLRLSTCLP